MKKIIFPLNFLHLLFYLLFLCITGAGVYFALIGFYQLIVNAQIPALFLIAVGGYTTYLFMRSLIYLWHNWIILYDNKLIVTGHWIVKKQGLQFPDEVEYDDIENVAIIYANANSKKKRIKNAGYSSLRPFVYYEIMLKNGETKWIYIECFARWQRKKILNTINAKTGLSLSYKQLERKDFSIYKRKQKHKDK